MKLVEKIIPDIRLALGDPSEPDTDEFGADEAKPAELWSPSWEKPEKSAEGG
jgi:hypothetical protein